MIFLDERNDLTLLFISCTGRPMRIEIVLAPATAQAVLPHQRHAPRLENWTFGEPQTKKGVLIILQFLIY